MDESVPGTAGLLQKGELYHYWEEDIHAASVLTPRELFDQLSLEGRHRHVAATSTSMYPPCSRHVHVRVAATSMSM